jgi:hypothetical protein
MANEPISGDKMNRAVVAFLNGQRRKGYVFNFSPIKDKFRLFPTEPAQEKSGSEILVNDLKAIFFVKDLEGDPENSETRGGDKPLHGRKIVVIFKDGEELPGTTEAYSPQKLGFFMFPLGKNSNNLRVFVINRNVREVKII